MCHENRGAQLQTFSVEFYEWKWYFLIVKHFYFKDGSTALHLAANHGQPKIVDLLIGKGIAVNLQDKVTCTHI